MCAAASSRGTPPCLVQRPSGRVLVARHHVEELDVRPAQRRGDEVDIQTVWVGRDRPDRRLERGEDLQGGQIAGILREDHVPRLQQSAGHEVDPLLRAAHDQDLARRGGHPPPAQVRRHPLAERAVPVRLAVLQPAPPIVRQDRGSRLAQRLHREPGRIRQPRGEVDHRPLRHHPDELHDGRGQDLPHARRIHRVPVHHVLPPPLPRLRYVRKPHRGRLPKNPTSLRLLKKVQMQGGARRAE